MTTCKHTRVEFKDGVVSCPTCKRAAYVGPYADKSSHFRTPKGAVRQGTKRALRLMLDFGTQVEDFLVGLGAKWDRPDKLHICAHLILDTPLGRLSLRPDDFTVFGRFDDPASAALLGGNGHSGKWNHHYWLGDLSGDTNAVEDFKRQINFVLRHAPVAVKAS